MSGNRDAKKTAAMQETKISGGEKTTVKALGFLGVGGGAPVR